MTRHEFTNFEKIDSRFIEHIIRTKYNNIMISKQSLTDLKNKSIF